jgi:hypothetical protein
MWIARIARLGAGQRKQARYLCEPLGMGVHPRGVDFDLQPTPHQPVTVWLFPSSRKRPKRVLSGGRGAHRGMYAGSARVRVPPYHVESRTRAPVRSMQRSGCFTRPAGRQIGLFLSQTGNSTVAEIRYASYTVICCEKAIFSPFRATPIVHLSTLAGLANRSMFFRNSYFSGC